MKARVMTLMGVVLAAMCFAQEDCNPKIAALTKKLDTIIIPEVQFREANVANVVQFLTMAAKQYDADMTGVNIVLMDKESKSRVTLTLQKTSLHKILKLTAEMAGLSLAVEEDGVVLRKPKVLPWRQSTRRPVEEDGVVLRKPKEEKKQADQRPNRTVAPHGRGATSG